MFASPPKTLWQDAACSLADPSPGLTAYTTLPNTVSILRIGILRARYPF